MGRLLIEFSILRLLVPVAHVNLAGVPQYQQEFSYRQVLLTSPTQKFLTARHIGRVEATLLSLRLLGISLPVALLNQSKERLGSIVTESGILISIYTSKDIASYADSNV